MEHAGETQDRQQAVYNQALQAGLQVLCGEDVLGGCVWSMCVWRVYVCMCVMIQLLNTSAYMKHNNTTTPHNHSTQSKLPTPFQTQGVEDVLEVVLARMDSLRRAGPTTLPQLRDVYQHTLTLLPTMVPGWVDRDLRLTDHMARCEVAAAAGGDMQGARGVWEQAIKGGLGRYAGGVGWGVGWGGLRGDVMCVV